MKISILCTHKDHPVYPHLKRWVEFQSKQHSVELVNQKNHLSGGDLLFLISCHELVDQEVRSQYKATLVIHASNLPRGRGWSPHVWQILRGENTITVSLLEAEDAVDAGAIWKKQTFALEGHELWDEINEKLFAVEVQLMDFAVNNFDRVIPTSQAQFEPTYYPKRTPEDSEIDPEKTIGEQFNLLRVCDPARFPAFFDLHGHRYKIIIQKQEK